ncbi:Olfactory receptor 2F1 [Galemys pyrenaicus]|uniref:Olfactory receptor 2F1 n=1 Tax=Galemys pyrenaicus TaxID=202257 RepID=A0A8J6AAM2_GALPY|nr:Olfactory receptor 2F1 [Galemys pyrenaicus]
MGKKFMTEDFKSFSVGPGEMLLFAAAPDPPAMDNLTWVSEFVLLGLSSDRQTQVGLFVLFGVAYLLTLLGNGLIILLICLDTRLHLPMYFFLCNLSVVDICYTSSGVPQMLVDYLLDKKTISFTRCGTQLFFSLGLGGTEFLLLVAMACDHPWPSVTPCSMWRGTISCDPVQVTHTHQVVGELQCSSVA